VVPKLLLHEVAMSRHTTLYSSKALNQWTTEVRQAFPNLSKPQAVGLATWSFGMVAAEACALTAVALYLAKTLHRNLGSLTQRLRDFYRPANAKKGDKRRDLDVTVCFAPLLRWVLRDWHGKQLALALDASSLQDRFVVLCISVVYRGCAIPVAWKVLPAAVKGAWQEPWLTLLEHFAALASDDYTIIALADRGLYAKWLFDGIRKLGWHPLLRINQGGRFRPAGWFHFVPLSRLVPHVGARWRGVGTAFATKKAQLACTLLGFWGEGHAEPWLLLTDLPPEQSDAAWYGLRNWIEQFFKDCKRGGWQWQKTRMTEVDRIERLWLALAVATLWLVRVGGEDELAEQGPLPELEVLRGEGERQRGRRVAVFSRGFAVIKAALINHERLPLGQLYPEPWPLVPCVPDPAQIQKRIEQVA
jgi:hypothetical protein